MHPVFMCSQRQCVSNECTWYAALPLCEWLAAHLWKSRNRTSHSPDCACIQAPLTNSTIFRWGNETALLERMTHCTLVQNDRAVVYCQCQIHNLLQNIICFFINDKWLGTGLASGRGDRHRWGFLHGYFGLSKKVSSDWVVMLEKRSGSDRVLGIHSQ